MRALLDAAVYLTLLMFSVTGSSYLYLVLTGAKGTWAAILGSSVAILASGSVFIIGHLFLLLRYGNPSKSGDLDWEEMVGRLRSLLVATAAAIVIGTTIAWLFPTG